MAEWEGFDVEGRLGAGTTGTVWLARQLSVGRQVALKELAPELAGDPAVRDRLRHEAQLLARLEHPNCVEVYAYLESSSAAAIVMEYVEGVSLRTLVEGGPLSVEQTLGVLEGSLDALAYAHGQGIVHGDLKPENILLATSGESKLVDFGLAAAVGTRRAPGTGSPTYSSPEAAAGEPLDASSDLYSAGLVLYELLTGAIPAGGGAAIAGGAATDALPAPVAALVQHALDPDPAARPQSATAFLEDLRTAAEAGCGSDWRRRAVIAPLVVAAASGAASALGAVKAGAATPGPAHSGAVAARRGSRVGHALHAHPWAAAALAGVVVVAGGAIGVAVGNGGASTLTIGVVPPMSGLDWRGFVITPALCQLGGDGDVQAEGSVVIPNAGARGEEVVGQLEAWVTDGSGHYLGHSRPWALPKVQGTYHWTIDVPLTAGTSAHCIVEGVDPGGPFATPRF